MSTLTHTCWHSLSHTLSHFFIQHMLFCLVTRRLVDNRDKCRQWCAGGLMDKLPLPTAGNVFGRLTMCCYLVEGNITLLLFMQNAIIKYKGLLIIVIVVLHFINRGMFERYWSDMPRHWGMSDQSGCNHILRYIF